MQPMLFWYLMLVIGTSSSGYEFSTCYFCIFLCKNKNPLTYRNSSYFQVPISNLQFFLLLIRSFYNFFFYFLLFNILNLIHSMFFFHSFFAFCFHNFRHYFAVPFPMHEKWLFFSSFLWFSTKNLVGTRVWIILLFIIKKKEKRGKEMHRTNTWLQFIRYNSYAINILLYFFGSMAFS